VVGSGGSGKEIADDLCEHGRTVYLSIGRCQRWPRRYREGYLDLVQRQIDSFFAEDASPAQVTIGQELSVKATGQTQPKTNGTATRSDKITAESSAWHADALRDA
jgi:cation diffusion facilitator CzcD-associated flavoprotein CzcO